MTPTEKLMILSPTTIQTNNLRDDPEASEVAALPPGWTGVRAEVFASAPMRMRSEVTVDDKDSFLAYLGRWANGGTEVFADLGSRTVLAILDHGAPDGCPAWASHRCKLAAALDERFAAWLGLHNQATKQVDFLEFLHDRAGDISSPKAGVVNDAIANFAVSRSTEVRAATRLGDGTVQIAWQEKDSGSETHARWPEHVVLKLPVFRGEPPVEINVHLRYSVREGKLTFLVWITDLDMLVRREFERMAQDIATKSKLTVHSGRVHVSQPTLNPTF